MTTLNIVPECYIDTKIAEILGQDRKYNHQHGCGDVANELKNKLQNNIAIGFQQATNSFFIIIECYSSNS
jgi:hypothetical protein